MPIKNINDLIMQGVRPERVKSLPRKIFSERIKETNPKYTTMSDVVPPLSRADFLNSWKEDRAQLEKVRKERDDAVKESKRLKGIMQTTWTKNWRSKVSEEEKK